MDKCYITCSCRKVTQAILFHASTPTYFTPPLTNTHPGAKLSVYLRAGGPLRGGHQGPLLQGGAFGSIDPLTPRSIYRRYPYIIDRPTLKTSLPYRPGPARWDPRRRGSWITPSRRWPSGSASSTPASSETPSPRCSRVRGSSFSFSHQHDTKYASLTIQPTRPKPTPTRRGPARHAVLPRGLHPRRHGPRALPPYAPEGPVRPPVLVLRRHRRRLLHRRLHRQALLRRELRAGRRSLQGHPRSIPPQARGPVRELAGAWGGRTRWMCSTVFKVDKC